MPRIPRAVHRNIPGIGWRDRKISFLETRVDQLLASRSSLTENLESITSTLHEERARNNSQTRAQMAEIETLRSDMEVLRELYETASSEHERFTRSSFKAKMSNYLGATDVARANGWHATNAIAQMNYKLRSYSLAESLGVDTPKILGVWNSPESIEFSDLDEEKFVLKADGGHSGIAVIPLIRNDSGWQTLTGKEQLTEGRPSDRMLKRLIKGRGPYFAEEFLESDGESTIPQDIKVYTAYGHILQVLVMQTEGKQVVNRQTFSRKYFDADGNDLGMILPGAVYDPDIPLPNHWDELLSAAKGLSIASGLPFLRVDLYATSRGPVLGELTSTPGGKQQYRLQHDAMLGAAWNRAEVRLERDIALGRPPGTLYGPDPYTWWYSESGEESHPSSWPRRVVDAERWYTPSPTDPPERV
ncbi:glutathione synthase/RimK-type ligase-like ATP-grasp enzyme [Nesterenkonia lutea]|uniref:Glutathione synthase/RimK-type ligase-like ATP-grasp enzyme n=2 Tax=Nesterenkonia lutea TaxID=272919 RepID=A0ABR9JD31_9MICC|nr:ATP-grasp fold amidoligase family protein [Nesterenkonia lutea]MBE1523721.1 glutathione synthase/RimK-type ligase-like ATP-grasp enzyme [Nesterenkonia lutea]